MTLSANDAQQSDAFAERLLAASLGMIDMLSIYIGDRLGLYRVLNGAGAMSPPQLAQRTGWHERYLREWLEQQAVTGILSVERSEGNLTFSLPRGHADVLLNRDSMNYMAPLALLLAGSAKAVPALLHAYRSGGGVSWSAYGDDVREGQGEVNRPPFLHLLPNEWLPSVPDLHARLQAEPPARVADIACGVGWSSIGIATGYPKVRVDGFDLDEMAIDIGRQNAREAHLADRVTFEVRDAADPQLEGRYDLVTIFEAVHDMSRPVHALQAARAMLAPGGSVLVVDERVQEEFTAPGDEVERLMYGWSILLCLANGMADEPSACTGTVMRPKQLAAYAADAGLSQMEVLPIDHLFFRFYLFRP